MARTVDPIQLSASTSGKPIAVTATATPGTLLHTATSVANGYDDLYLMASNIDSTDRTITVEFGGATDAELLVKNMTIPANSQNLPICVGLRVSGGIEIRAFCSAANAVNFTGNVNRISAP